MNEPTLKLEQLLEAWRVSETPGEARFSQMKRSIQIRGNGTTESPIWWKEIARLGAVQPIPVCWMLTRG